MIGRSPPQDIQRGEWHLAPTSAVYPRDRLLILAIAVGLMLCGCDRSTSFATQVPSVVIEETHVVNATTIENFSGRVSALESVEIRPRISGYVEGIHFKEGTTVAKGDLLFTIDPRSYKAELQRAEAALATARSRYGLAKQVSARADRLLSLNAVSRQEQETLAANLQEAAAAIEAAKAEVERARLDLSFTRIQAPISGTIGQAFITRGNLIGTGDSQPPLTTIVVSDPVYVYFNMDEQSFLRLTETEGLKDAQVAVSIGEPPDVATSVQYQGHLDFVNNGFDTGSGTIRVRAVVPNPDKRLVPGLYAHLGLHASRPSPMLLIDERAVLTDQDRKYVYVLDSENKAQRRDVMLGRKVEGKRAVLKGLDNGEKIIVEGVQKVFAPGITVRPEISANARSIPSS